MGVRRLARIAVCALLAGALSAAVAVPASAGAVTGRPRPTVDRTPPSQPTNLHVVSVTQTSVTLAWNPSTDNVGRHDVLPVGRGPLRRGLRDPSEHHGDVDVPAASRTDRDVPGDRLRRPVQRLGGECSRHGHHAGRHDRAVDTERARVDNVTASTVSLTWNSGTDLFQPVRHEILVNGVPTGDAVSNVPAGTIPRPAVQGATVRQLDPGATYQFSVRAIDPSGNVSQLSNVVAATTQASADTVAPTSPTMLSACDGGNGSCPEELWLRWSASTDDGPASGIEYEVRVNGVINEVIPVGTQTVTYTEVLGPNTVTIVAVDQAGNASAPSNAMTVVTNWAPGGCGLP